MPIHCPITITNLSADEFAAVDYRVMGHAYTCHNDLGRLCDECAYEADLKTRLLADGLQQVHTQVPLTVSHKSFSKTYQLDLVVENALYELKAATRLIGEHDTQILNYMLLLGLGRGKLLNFRPAKVEGQIRATSLSQEDRRKFTLMTSGWQGLTPACGELRQTLVDLLTDWARFLILLCTMRPSPICLAARRWWSSAFHFPATAQNWESRDSPSTRPASHFDLLRLRKINLGLKTTCADCSRLRTFAHCSGSI